MSLSYFLTSSSLSVAAIAPAPYVLAIMTIATHRLARLALLSLGLALTAPAGAQAPASNAVTIGISDTIWSPTLREKRDFLVYTPPSYHSATFLPHRYPVLYLLDGDAHFHSVSGLIQILGTGVNATFVIPEMIVVAIPNTDRLRDLSPTHVDKDPAGNPAPGMKTSGGMPNFLRFIKTELIPRIDSQYRTEPYRVLVGHSLGGIAVIDALYTIPETFNAYVAIDPSLWWDNQVLLKQAKAFVSKPGLNHKTLYVGQANTVDPDDASANVHFNSIVQFNTILDSYNKSGLRYGYKYYSDDNHGSVPLIAEYDALRFIFAGYGVDLLKDHTSPAWVKEHFAQVSARLAYPMVPPEQTVNLLGNVELGRDTTKAIALLQMNADNYPRSFHAWDALGAAWQTRGDSKKAIAAFQKSLELNPKNQHATDMIAKEQSKTPF